MWRSTCNRRQSFSALFYLAVWRDQGIIVFVVLEIRLYILIYLLFQPQILSEMTTVMEFDFSKPMSSCSGKAKVKCCSQHVEGIL